MKKIFLAAITLFIINASYAQNKAGTLLWKVTKPGNDKVSYLFGTFHQVNPDFFDSLSVAKNLLIKSDALFVESYQTPDNTNSNRENNSNLDTWDKQKWKSASTESQFEVFEKFAKSGWVDEQIYTLPPVILMLILQDMYFQGVCDTVNRNSYDKMDDRITHIGLRSKIKVEGLDENQLLDIKKSTGKDLALSQKNIIKTDEQYINYILQKNTDNPIAKFLFDYKEHTLDYALNTTNKELKHLLNGRNDKWMKKLPNQFDIKNCFVAVGIRHLFYKNGLIQQLRRQGYTVEPVKLFSK